MLVNRFKKRVHQFCQNLLFWSIFRRLVVLNSRLWTEEKTSSEWFSPDGNCITTTQVKFFLSNKKEKGTLPGIVPVSLLLQVPVKIGESPNLKGIFQAFWTSLVIRQGSCQPPYPHDPAHMEVFVNTVFVNKLFGGVCKQALQHMVQSCLQGFSGPSPFVGWKNGYFFFFCCVQVVKKVVGEFS